MKSFAACFVVLALAACSSSSTPSTTSGGSGTGSTGSQATTTGGKTSTGTGTGGATGTAAGTTTGAPLGSPCTIDASGNDSCSQYNLMCSADLTGLAGSGNCILPQALVDCDPTGYGCQDGGTPTSVDGGTSWDAGVETDAGIDVDAGDNSDAGVDEVWVDAGPFWVDGGTYWDAGVAGQNLVCASGFQNNTTGAQAEVCLVPCTSSSDCDQVYLGCLGDGGGTYFIQPQGCFYNECATDYAACSATAAADGQCLPYVDANGNPTVSICYQNGSAATAAPCDPNVRNGLYSECGYSSFCVPNATEDAGLCYPVTLDGGNCASTDDAIEAPPSPLFGNANFGICVQDCTTGQTCTVGTCQQIATGVSGCMP